MNRAILVCLLLVVVCASLTSAAKKAGSGRGAKAGRPPGPSVKTIRLNCFAAAQDLRELFAQTESHMLAMAAINYFVIKINLE